MALRVARGLAQRGHRVTLVGLAGSQADGIPVWPVSLPTPFIHPLDAPNEDDGPFPELFAWLEAQARRDLQVVHLHLMDPAALRLADALARRFPSLRVVSTLHMAGHYQATARAVQALIAASSPIHFVSPSHYAAGTYDMDGVLVIPNGVDLARHPLVPYVEENAPLAWVGRRVPEKGLRWACAIAQRTGRNLLVVGEGPRVTGHGIIDLGYVPPHRVPRVVGNAAALLVTSTAPETQSLVAIEAMACGTPVVAFDSGALRDTVVSGVTGFVVPSMDLAGAIDAVSRLRAIERSACRVHVEKHFHQDQMLDAYELLYTRSIPRDPTTSGLLTVEMATAYEPAP